MLAQALASPASEGGWLSLPASAASGGASESEGPASRDVPLLLLPHAAASNVSAVTQQARALDPIETLYPASGLAQACTLHGFWHVPLHGEVVHCASPVNGAGQ